MNENVIIAPSGTINKRIKLAPVDVALKNKHASFAVAYNGQFNIDKIIYSIKTALQAYDFFYGMFDHSSNELQCRYFGENDARNCFNPVQLEIDSKEIGFDLTARISDYKNDLITSFIPSTNNKTTRHNSLVQIKITNFNNFCVFGIHWDHALSDFKGIFNFIKYVSNVYNDHCNNENDAPIFDRRVITNVFDSRILLNKEKVSKTARNKIAVVSKTLKILGFLRYIYNSIFNYVPAYLIINDKKLEEDKSFILENKKIKVSSNDLLNALLLKMFSDCCSSKKQKTSLYYPINTRGLLNISQHFIGNCLGNISDTFAPETLKSLEIHDIAIQNRIVADNYNLTHITEDYCWSDYWLKNGAEKKVYHRWLFGINRVYSSNWTSFGMEDVNFSGLTFHAILRSSRVNRFLVFPAFHATILPYSDNNKIRKMIRISLHKKHLALITAKKYAYLEDVTLA